MRTIHDRLAPTMPCDHYRFPCPTRPASRAAAQPAASVNVMRFEPSRCEPQMTRVDPPPTSATEMLLRRMAVRLI